MSPSGAAWPSTATGSPVRVEAKRVWRSPGRGGHALSNADCDWGGGPLLVKAGREVTLGWGRLVDWVMKG
jgi:hypothetical protein